MQFTKTCYMFYNIKNVEIQRCVSLHHQIKKVLFLFRHINSVKYSRIKSQCHDVVHSNRSGTCLNKSGDYKKTANKKT